MKIDLNDDQIRRAWIWMAYRSRLMSWNCLFPILVNTVSRIHVDERKFWKRLFGNRDLIFRTEKLWFGHFVGHFVGQFVGQFLSWNDVWRYVVVMTWRCRCCKCVDFAVFFERVVAVVVVVEVVVARVVGSLLQKHAENLTGKVPSKLKAIFVLQFYARNSKPFLSNFFQKQFWIVAMQPILTISRRPLTCQMIQDSNFKF